MLEYNSGLLSMDTIELRIISLENYLAVQRLALHVHGHIPRTRNINKNLSLPGVLSKSFRRHMSILIIRNGYASPALRHAGCLNLSTATGVVEGLSLQGLGLRSSQAHLAV